MGIKTKIKTTVKAIKDCKRLWRIVAVVYYAWITYGIATNAWHPLVNAILFGIVLVERTSAEWEAREWEESFKAMQKATGKLDRANAELVSSYQGLIAKQREAAKLKDAQVTMLLKEIWVLKDALKNEQQAMTDNEKQAKPNEGTIV